MKFTRGLPRERKEKSESSVKHLINIFCEEQLITITFGDDLGCLPESLPSLIAGI